MAKMKRIWDNFVVVGEVQKSDAIKFVVAAAVRDGVKYVNIREFYLKKSEGIWKPGRDGITIPVKTPIKQATEIIQPLHDIHYMIVDASNMLKELPIYDEANAIYVEEKTK